MKYLMTLLTVLSTNWINLAAADSTEARCDIYPKGEDHASAMIPCTFGQRQGNVTITRSDGITHGNHAIYALVIFS